MASKPRSEATIRRSRRRLIARLERMSQLELFRGMDEETRKAITKLEGKISLASKELELVRPEGVNA
jgi:hypothetical protein